MSTTRRLIALVLPLLAACKPTAEPATGEDACREAVIAASRRTATCTGDAELANRVGEDLDGRPCTAETPGGETPGPLDVSCARALYETECADVPRLAADPGEWLQVAGCDGTFGR